MAASRRMSRACSSGTTSKEPFTSVASATSVSLWQYQFRAPCSSERNSTRYAEKDRLAARRQMASRREHLARY